MAWRAQQFVDAFTLKKYVAKGVDVMVVRELNGGVDDERARQGHADGEWDAQGAHDRTS